MRRPPTDRDRRHLLTWILALGVLAACAAPRAPTDGSTAPDPAAERWSTPAPRYVLADSDPLLAETAGIDTPERHALRDRIVADLLATGRPVAGRRPVLYLMGGGSASGKGVIGDMLERQGLVPQDGVVHLDPDEIKSALPEYNQILLVGDARASSVVHEESSALNKRAFSEALKARTDVVLDVTLGSPGKGMRLIRDARAAAYEVRLFGVMVDPIVAVARVTARANVTGRYVPTDQVLRTHRGFAAGFEAYTVLVDQAVLYDTGNATGPPVLVARKLPEGRLELLAADRYRAFQRERGIDIHAPGPATLYRDQLATVQLPWTRDQYIAAAMENLQRTSRTANGVIDLSASRDKANSLVEGLDADEAAARVVAAYRALIGSLYDRRDQRFESPEALRDFVESAARQANDGILRDGVLIRTHDSDKYPYTRVVALEAAMTSFYRDLLGRLADPQADAVRLAAWVELRIDLTDHFFADGCGKTSKAISAWVLMRAGMPLPLFPEDRDDVFDHAPAVPRGEDPLVDAGQLDVWEGFYATLMPRVGPLPEHVSP